MEAIAFNDRVVLVRFTRFEGAVQQAWVAGVVNEIVGRLCP